MTYDKTQTIDGFLNAAAAKAPTPGGGSVAALAGALGASMGEMVLNYSIGKKDLAQFQEAFQHAIAELTRARQVLLELMVEDQAAYETLTAIRKMPVTEPDRAGKLEAALLVCIRIPQTIGITAAAVLDICDRVADSANKYLLSDLAVCAELAMATVRCASYNVRVNCGDVPDPAERTRFKDRATQQVLDASRIIQRVMPRIWARLERS